MENFSITELYIILSQSGYKKISILRIALSEDAKLLAKNFRKFPFQRTLVKNKKGGERSVKGHRHLFLFLLTTLASTKTHSHLDL